MPTKRGIRNPNTVQRKGDRYTERKRCRELKEAVRDQLPDDTVEDGENGVPHADHLSNSSSNCHSSVTVDQGKGSSSIAPVQPEAAVTGGMGPSGTANGSGHMVFPSCWDPRMGGIWESSLSKASGDSVVNQPKEEDHESAMQQCTPTSATGGRTVGTGAGSCMFYTLARTRDFNNWGADRDDDFS